MSSEKRFMHIVGWTLSGLTFIAVGMMIIHLLCRYSASVQIATKNSADGYLIAVADVGLSTFVYVFFAALIVALAIGVIYIIKKKKHRSQKPAYPAKRR